MSRKLFFLLFSSVILNVQVIFASHAMGGDMTYQCLDSNQYMVTYTFYRDCSGIPAPPTADLTISDISGASAMTVTLMPTANSPTKLHTTCATAATTCDSAGTYLGIEKWVYTGIITLSYPSSWIIYHSENARNAAITTITGAGSDDLFVYAVINNVNGMCNNSAVFNSDPSPIICQGVTSCLSNLVTDADGDSLVYELIVPKTGP